MMEKFHRSKAELSLIINVILEDLYDRFNFLFASLALDQEALNKFSEAVKDKGAPLDNCFGFIDGTVRPMCRPINGQRLFYNGHKRVHAIKFQSVSLPNGLVADLYGPTEGRRHDAYLLQSSHLLTRLQALPRKENGDFFCLYGDPAYPITPRLMCPFKGAALDEDQREFNKSMSSCRQTVEWCFGKISTNFAFLDFKKDIKILLQPIAKYYIIGALLTNCHTCLYGSQTSMFFACSPPTLENYLAGNLC